MTGVRWLYTWIRAHDTANIGTSQHLRGTPPQTQFYFPTDPTIATSRTFTGGRNQYIAPRKAQQIAANTYYTQSKMQLNVKRRYP